MPIYPYSNTRGETLYRVDFTKPDHKRSVKRGFKRKRDAELFLASVQVSKARGEFIDATESRVTVGELGATWINSQSHLKPSTMHALESTYRVHVLPRWGGQRIGTIRHTAVQGWVSDLSRTHSPTIVRRAHGALSSILNNAVKDRRILENPAKEITLPRRVKKPDIFLSHSQVQDLAEASGEHSTLVLTLAYTGLRWGEATGLRVQDIDFNRARLTVVQNAVMVGGHIEVGTPKTHQARTVPIPAFLLPLLRMACEGKLRTELVFGNGTAYLRQPSHGDGWLEVAVRKCQQADSDFPRVTAHDLRHTAASLAISAGANVKAVQRMLGHASAVMTLDRYASLFEDDLIAVAEALSNAASRESTSKIRQAG